MESRPRLKAQAELPFFVKIRGNGSQPTRDPRPSFGFFRLVNIARLHPELRNPYLPCSQYM